MNNLFGEEIGSYDKEPKKKKSNCVAQLKQIKKELQDILDFINKLKEKEKK